MLEYDYHMERTYTMLLCLLTALGVGGATILGTAFGFPCRKISHRFSDIVLAFAAGVMLAAAIWGLIIPAMEHSGSGGLLVTICGILAGAFCISLVDRLVPHIHKLIGWEDDLNAHHFRRDRLVLFVAAMAIHNFPEGLAAGVSLGSGDYKAALLIAGGIALQNIPEGLVTVTPMLAAGISPRKTFLCGAATGIIEMIGTFAGFYAVTLASAVLPFFLAFAGGTMLFVISDEMIPETHDHGNERAATYSLLMGFCLMLVMDVVLA